jgi:hypothetical protein
MFTYSKLRRLYLSREAAIRAAAQYFEEAVTMTAASREPSDGPLHARDPGLGEVRRLEHETEMFETEVQAWSDAIRLSEPGQVPGFHDMLAASETLTELCTRKLQHLPPNSADAKFVENIQKRSATISNDIRDHIVSLQPDKKK